MSFLGQKQVVLGYIFFYFLLFFSEKKIEISGARRPIDLCGFYFNI